jgi:hypothetical protein
MATVFVAGNQVTLNPKDAIGKGGEADVYRYKNKALKIYKDEKHVDLQGDPHGQRAATERLAIHQRKLPAFPKGLPANVIAPEDLATDKKNLIVGYDMQLLPTAEVLMAYADQGFRQKGVSSDQVRQILVNLYDLTAQVHNRGIVIGDNNDLNILVAGTDVYLVDTDAWQFTGAGEMFYCTTFTNKFVDPMLCDPNATCPLLMQPHTPASDWYAYYVMMFQLLLFVDPFGGMYKPKDASKRIPHDARSLHRVTVFNPEVQYPKPATHYSVLPDEMSHFFQLTFEKDQRKQMELSWIRNMRWTTCVNCGMEHARAKCPGCAAAVPGVVTQVVQVRGQVVATREFKTEGVIVYGAYQNGKLHYLYHDKGELHREGGLFKLSAALVPGVRYRLHGNKTVLGNAGRMIVTGPNQQPEVTTVDNFGNKPMFDANSHSTYWINNGQLLTKRPGEMQNRFIGDVLQNQTLFWVGEDMGFGFYRAGAMNVAFVFDAHKGGLNDTVKLGHIRGQLIDANCCFSKDRCWFFLSTQENGKTTNQCYLYKLDGTLLGSRNGEEGDGTWLGTIRGNCAVGNFLLVGTDDGIVRVECDGNLGLEVVKEFPDTEPWVNCKSNLFPGLGGIYVLSGKEVTLLKIS